MGVEARIVLFAGSEEAADTAFRAAFARIEELDAILSDWRQDSELARLNDAAGRGPRRVSADLYRVLSRSVELARSTEGAFDPTVGPVTALWREARESRLPPEPEAVELVRDRVGFAKLRLDEAAGMVELTEPGMRLDLGAVGKGYACDRALDVLRACGSPSALVQLGGDIAAGDPPPGEASWRIAVGDRRIEVANRGIGTSGSSAQHLDAGGVRYSHVLDPRSGRAVEHSRSITVIAADATTSDALATAANVLDVETSKPTLAAFREVKLFVEEPQWKSLFDGKTLEGWVTKGGRYDGNAIWTVEDGCLVGRVDAKGEGGLIYTDRYYTAFVFECDVRVDYPFDSGVFVRMVPPENGGKKGAQVTLDDRPDGEIGAVYADGFLVHNDPAPGRFWKRDAWNHVKVEVTGFDMRIRAWINGSLATDYALPSGTEGYAPSGRIGLQVHGGMGEPKSSAARFRDVKVRELPVFGEGGEGWTPLFDGKTLDGWEEHGTKGAWRVRDGVLGCLFGTEGGDLRTQSDYRDFDLRLEFRISRMANSGVFLRAKRDDSNPAFSGCEIQILDDFDWEEETQTKLKPWQFTGSLYGSVPANAPGVLRPIGEWNRYEVLCRGKRIAVALNGRTLYDVDVTEVPADPPFAARAPAGFIGLQRHAADGPAGEDAVAFRNIHVRN